MENPNKNIKATKNEMGIIEWKNVIKQLFLNCWMSSMVGQRRHMMESVNFTTDK